MAVKETYLFDPGRMVHSKEDATKHRVQPLQAARIRLRLDTIAEPLHMREREYVIMSCPVGGDVQQREIPVLHPEQSQLCGTQVLTHLTLLFLRKMNQGAFSASLVSVLLSLLMPLTSIGKPLRFGSA